MKTHITTSQMCYIFLCITELELVCAIMHVQLKREHWIISYRRASAEPRDLDEDDEGSDSSSDLFELESIAGANGDELPVYYTTSLVANRAHNGFQDFYAQKRKLRKRLLKSQKRSRRKALMLFEFLTPSYP